MQNPNIKVSKTKVVIKNINKDLGDNEVRNFIKKCLKENYKIKKLNTMKVLKKINILKEDTGRSKGIAFVEFASEKLAEEFMVEIVH